MFHYRESRGPEIDLLVDKGECLHAVEIKSGATAASDFFKHFEFLPERLKSTGLPSVIKNHVVYGGEKSQQRSSAQLVAWCDVPNVLVPCDTD